MQKIITILIEPDQTGFIPCRHGANNIKKNINYDGMSKTNHNYQCYLGLDMQKAFGGVHKSEIMGQSQEMLV